MQKGTSVDSVNRPVDRRAFLKRFLATAGCFAASASAVPFSPGISPAHAQSGLYRFPQGVASGDPQPDAVMLWTRVEPAIASTAPIDLYVQLSEREDFTTIVLQQALRATTRSDYTVRFLAQGLKPDTVYFYRFFAGGDQPNFIGRTRTAPAADAERPVRFAFVSCQNYEAGFYGAYRRLVLEDEAAAPEERIDFVLHLGDFIYEVAGDVPEEITPARLLPALPDGSEPWVPDGTRPWWRRGAQAAVTLADYRHLYKTYLSDPDLQAARARFAFVNTWDDHEFTNDSWQSHDTYFGDGEPAQKRKVAANQAWFEFVPAILTGAESVGGVGNPARDFRRARVRNAPMGEPDDTYLFQGKDNLAALGSLTIYRTSTWGKVLDLVVTDTRSYRSPPVMTEEVDAFLDEAPLPPIRIIRTLDAGRAANGGEPPETLSYGTQEIANPRRDKPAGTCLGAAQKDWFKATLKASSAAWRIWANSIPALALRLDLSKVPFADLEDGYVGTDAWQGYPGELGELMRFVREEQIPNVVSCAGDYHMHAAGRLPVDPDADDLEFAAAEFATTSISSNTVFHGAERSTRNSATFRQVVVIEDGEDLLPNWNNTLVNGMRAGMATAYTGSPMIGRVVSNRRASPGLEHMDSNAHGFSVATVEVDRMTVTFVDVGDVRKDAGPAGPPVRCRTTFTLNAWGPGGEPEPLEPSFEGEPPFPYG